MVEDAFLRRPERRGAAAVEVQRLGKTQLACDVGCFGDGRAVALAFETPVDHGHHHRAVGPFADQRPGMAARVETAPGGVFDHLAAVDQHRACGQRRAVAARHVGILRRVAREDLHPAALAVLEGDDAVGAECLLGGGASHDLPVEQDEGDRFEGFDVEVAAVDGDLRAGGLPQIARGLGPAIEVDDRGGEPASGVGGDGDALPRPEHVDLGVAAFGAAAEVGRAPLGGGECNRVAGCLRRGAGGKEEQQGSRQNFVHGSDKRVSSHKFTHLARI